MLYLESFLEVMAPVDLLQWLHLSKKTGACSFIQGHKSRRLYLREGLIVASESNEPHLLLGQFLISTGRILPGTLRESMMTQERSGTRLGDVLVDSGKISEAELQRVLTAKAEETVYGLFEWQQGVFRFVPDVEPPANAMHVELQVQRVLLEGARRADEMERALQILNSPNVILHKTDRTVDGPTVASYMGRQLYDLIDGRRTLSELILQSRTSPYLAYSFFSRLVERDLITVGELCEIRSAADERDHADVVISELQQLVAHEQHEAALDLIDHHAIKQDGDSILSMLIAKAEAGFLATAYRSKVPPDAVPHRAHGYRSHDVIVRGDLSTEELFLFELVDGTWDVRSLVWISPLRKVEVIRGLMRLRDLGYIELHPPTCTAVVHNENEKETVNEDSSEHSSNQAIDNVFCGKNAPGAA